MNATSDRSRGLGLPATAAVTTRVLRMLCLAVVLSPAWHGTACAQWQRLNNPPPFAASTALLLTDGTVMCQAVEAVDWWRLTPDSSGSYVNGTWTQLASMHNPRLAYASAVLADGRVVVAGGEYNGTGKQVELDAAEIYDPLTDTWTDLPTPGWGHIGDAPCAVLPNGSLLLGDIESGKTALLDPVSLTWSPSGPKLNGSSTEETWTLLPNGSVLTADCVQPGKAELYDPLSGLWFFTGAIMPYDNLVEKASAEIGPALLLPSGMVFATGATGHNAYYVPLTGIWRWAPDFPRYTNPVTGSTLPRGIKDGPACLLPSGAVFCAAAPVDGLKDDFLPLDSFWEFNGAFHRVAAPPSNSPNSAPSDLRMLLLPTGEVFVTYENGEAFIYSHPGKPQTGWAPTITSCPAVVARGATYTLTGTQLNGLSQANSFGDDATNATNYPLVRITNLATGHVCYARTAHYSTMAVATGQEPVSTQFTVAAGCETGPSLLVVVANGIASTPVNVTVVAGPNG